MPTPLPRGAGSLPRDVVFVSQRRRLLDAVVQSAAQKGFAATTVGDITGRAGVSRSTFYEQFSDKEECFLAAYEDGGWQHYRAVAGAVAGAGEDPLDQLRAGVRAYLAVLVREPAFARTFLLEVVAAGPRALAKRRELQERYVRLLERLHDALRAQLASVPTVPREAIIGATAAVDELVVRRIREGQAAELEDLQATGLYILLSVLGYPGAAAELASVVGEPELDVDEK